MLTDGRRRDGRTTDARVTGILIAHLGAFGSGELKRLIIRAGIHKRFTVKLVLRGRSKKNLSYDYCLMQV